MSMKMKAIVAVDSNWAIGKDNELLFHISDDLKRFKEITTGNIVVMGRKTFESLPNRKPLPNRTNIILTTNRNFHVDDAEVAHNFYDLNVKLNILRKENQKVFVIGGESIYKLFLPVCDEVFVTKIYSEYPGADRFFPNLEKDYRWVDSDDIATVRRDKQTGLFYEFKKYYNSTLTK